MGVPQKWGGGGGGVLTPIITDLNGPLILGIWTLITCTDPQCERQVGSTDQGLSQGGGYGVGQFVDYRPPGPWLFACIMEITWTGLVLVYTL